MVLHPLFQKRFFAKPMREKSRWFSLAGGISRSRSVSQVLNYPCDKSNNPDTSYPTSRGICSQVPRTSFKHSMLIHQDLPGLFLPGPLISQILTETQFQDPQKVGHVLSHHEICNDLIFISFT